MEIEYENDYRKLGGFKRSKFAHTVKKNSKTISTGIEQIHRDPITYKAPQILRSTRNEVEIDYVNDYYKLAFIRLKAHVVMKDN